MLWDIMEIFTWDLVILRYLNFYQSLIEDTMERIEKNKTSLVLFLSVLPFLSSSMLIVIVS